MLSEREGGYHATGTSGSFEQLTQNMFIRNIASDYENNKEIRDFFDFDTVQERLREKNTVMMELKSVNRKWHSVAFFANRRDENGNVIDVLFVIRDIAEQKKRELEKDEALREQLAIFNALADAYENVFFIDVDKETARGF